MLIRKGITIKARFDGKVFVPEDPVNLSMDTLVELQYRSWQEKETEIAPLARLVVLAKKFPPNPDSPGDAAMQHDHYLYGTPKHLDP